MHRPENAAHAVLAALFGVLLLLALDRPARAADEASPLHTGDHYGLWHGDEARFTIDQLDEKGKFSGHVELLDGTYKGAKFDFTGELTDRGAVRLKRSDADQICRAEAPERIGSHHVWRGKTYIAETNAKLLFELRVRVSD